MTNRKNPIIVALDTKDVSQAIKLSSDLKNYVGAIKLGLEFFCANGIEGVKAVEKTGMPIFLDLKLHDIPNTVAEAISGLLDLNIFILTIHTSGGAKMMEAASKAIKGKEIVLAGVTVLTSLVDQDLKDLGVNKNSQEQVINLVNLAKRSGLNGIVCSPLEVKEVKKSHQDIITIVPGIRPEGSDLGDQKRIMTPKQAIESGADYLVIGRPITKSPDPVKAAKEILESLE